MICRSTDVRAALKSRQRGFILDPYRFASTPATDPDFASVVWLLQGNGANNGTSFPDSSSYARTQNASSGVITSTAQSQWGGSSINIPTGSSRNVNTDLTSTNLGLGSGAFSVELWFYPTSAGPRYLFSYFYVGQVTLLYVVLNSGGTVTGACNRGPAGGYAAFGSAASPGTVTLNAWNFARYKRSGNNFTMELNGSESSATSSSFSIGEGAGSTRMYLGWEATAGATENFAGYANDLRVSKVARASGTPAAQFPTSA